MVRGLDCLDETPLLDIKPDRCVSSNLPLGALSVAGGLILRDRAAAPALEGAGRAKLAVVAAKRRGVGDGLAARPTASRG